jgi:hypothetical protein
MGKASFLILNVLMKSELDKIHQVLLTQVLQIKKKLLSECNWRRTIKRSQAMVEASNAMWQCGNAMWQESIHKECMRYG